MMPDFYDMKPNERKYAQWLLDTQEWRKRRLSHRESVLLLYYLELKKQETLRDILDAAYLRCETVNKEFVRQPAVQKCIAIMRDDLDTDDLLALEWLKAVAV